MLRCRDACVRCAGGKKGMGLLLNGTRGIASRTASLGGTQNGLRVRGQSSGVTLAVPAVSGLQRGNFSATTARGISGKELEDLRNQISLKEEGMENEGSDKADRKDGRKRFEIRPKPAMSPRALDEELRWLKDPRQMANRVTKMLQKGQVDKALELVHRAHKEEMECIVAWNLIIDYEMQKKRPDSAFKIYNDMKKRGQRPEAHTYTIMFRGLASNVTSSKSVSRAQSIYESLCSPSSGVKPSTTHNNAVLNVCARHGDMEALWEFAGKLPEEGYGEPDAVTYTTILNALKATTVKDIQGLDPKHQSDGITEVKAASVREGKRVWADIVKKWREGSLMVDAQLARAMGQLLLFGGRHRDCQDVFSLLHQTMGIQVIGGRREEERRHRLELLKASTAQGAHAQKGEEFEDIVTEPGASDQKGESELEEKAELTEEEEFKELFEPVHLDNVRRKVELKAGVKRIPELEYPKPTNSELTLIIGACIGLREDNFFIGKSYWRDLTHETLKFKIVPDQTSYTQLLRLHRASRASGRSLVILRDMVSRFKILEKKNYLIAMSACSRDRNNPNIMNTANNLLDLMNSAQAGSDPGTLDKYLSLVFLFTGSGKGLDLKSRVRFDGFWNTGKNKTELKGAILTRAQEKLRPHIQEIKSTVENCDPGLYAKTKIGDVSPSKKEPANFTFESRGRSKVDAGTLQFLSSARELYNRLVGSDVRELLSASEAATYRAQIRSLDDLLERQKKRDT